MTGGAVGDARRPPAVAAPWRRGRAPWLLAIVMSVASPALGMGQQTPPAPALPDTLPALTVSPGGALWRSLLVPGWGHVAIGSYTRGGFYFGLEAATIYTFLRTRHRLSDVRARAAFRENVVRADLAAEGVTDPAEIQQRLDADVALTGLEQLEASREGHQEDLIAFGIFLVFISGADAFVSAHLSRFPTPIEIDAAPTADGGAELGFRVTLPR